MVKSIIKHEYGTPNPIPREEDKAMLAVVDRAVVFLIMPQRILGSGTSSGPSLRKQRGQLTIPETKGIGVVAAQDTINAALGAVKDVLNKAIGFPLL